MTTGRRPRDRLAAIVISGVILSGCGPDTSHTQPAADLHAPPIVLGNETCRACHRKAYDHWSGSHHDLAMQVASPETVLGDFDNARFDYGGVESVFSRSGERFFVRTDGPDGKLADFEIAWTFGVEPLQQYLIELPGGRLQALSIVWDTRAASDGGQRWFHLYPGEPVTHDHPLHWTGLQQNWNFMCAECHSTEVRKNYDASSDSYATTFSETDVGCEACHGPGSVHIARAKADDFSAGLAIETLEAYSGGTWVMDYRTGIARRSPESAAPPELDACARCHARRATLSEAAHPATALLDTHQPALLAEGLYFADGQIREEVYVYGSFLQSAMYHAGVTCGDCHDAHSLAVTPAPGAVCARCHSPDRFDTRTHHGHESDVVQCVDCHMPERVYMSVDRRRDHSFRVPRPDLSALLGTPNACADCHGDRTASWAADQIADWHGTARRDDVHYGEALAAGRQQAAGAGRELVALSADLRMPDMVRATAVSLLPANPHPTVPTAIEEALVDDDGIVRHAAVQARARLGGQGTAAALAPLLEDPLLAVRIEAVASIAGRRSELPVPARAPFDRALAEYRDTLALNADRPEAHLSKGLLLADLGDLAGAVASYQQAIALVPQFSAAYINMADLYRASGDEKTVESILRRALVYSPDDAGLHHALALSLVRQQRGDEALGALRRAVDLAPGTTRLAYALGVALNSFGQPDESLTVLESALARSPANRDLLLALATISRDRGAASDALSYARALAELDPSDPAAQALLRELGR